MSADSYRVLLAGGIFMLLLFLRLEARRFGAAEYDEPGERRRSLVRRVSWYALGVAMVVALFLVHPAPHDVLYLIVGPREFVLIDGAILAAVGLALAAALAWLRYGYVRLPPPAAYPGAGLNAIATAFIDEATYRGALLGAMLAIGLPDAGSVVLMTIVYVLVTRAAAPGRHYSMLVVGTFLGAAGGWATLASGGIGAAFIGHAVTSFAMFVFTGHAGQVPRDGREPEELAVRTDPPKGWVDARLVRGSAADALAAVHQTYHDIGPSGFRSRADRWSAGRSRGLLAWIASAGRAATGGKPRDRSTADRRAAERTVDRRPAANSPDARRVGPRTNDLRLTSSSSSDRKPAPGGSPRDQARR
jgi:hypothetical protein